MECGLLDIFSRHICYTVAETIGVTNYASSFGLENVQKTTFESAEMILGRWNQQTANMPAEVFQVLKELLYGQYPHIPMVSFPIPIQFR